MAILNQKRILNLIPKVSAPVTIHVSQGDVGTQIEFTLVKGDEVFVNPGNVTASVHGVREDGANFGPFTCTLSGSKVTFPLHSEMTAVKGSALAEIVLVNNSGNKVGSANFGILVEESVFPLGVTYDNDVSVYESILAYVQTISAQVEADITAAVAQEANIRATADATFNTALASTNSNLASEVEARTSADTTINARIDEIIAPSGEAPSAAEVQDARIGADGVTYNNLGNAIRTQIMDLVSSLGYVIDVSNVTWETGSITSSGEVNTERTTDRASDFIPVLSPSKILLSKVDVRTARYVAGYDENHNFVRSFRQDTSATQSDLTISISRRIKYIRATKHENTTAISMKYVDINDAIYDVAKNLPVIYNSEVEISSSNKTSYFVDANDAPLNSIYRIDRQAEILNTPYGDGITTAAGEYMDGVRSFAGYLDGTLITYGYNTPYRHQIFISSRRDADNPPPITILYFRTYYSGNWGDWKKASSDASLTASNIAIRKKMIAPYIDSEGNPTATDTGIANPQYMGDDPLIFNDFNNAPKMSVYQIDKDCDATVMLNNPKPGRSSILITTNFAYATKHGQLQICIGLETNGSFMFWRYGYQDSGYIFTDWQQVINPRELAKKVPDAPTTDGTYVLKATVLNGTATYHWIAES